MSPAAILSSSTSSLSSIFPELLHLIPSHNRRLSSLSGGANNIAIDHHNSDSGSSAMLRAQNPEDEAFDFSDEEDFRTSDLHTVAGMENVDMSIVVQRALILPLRLNVLRL